MSEATGIAMESIRRHEGRVVDGMGWHVVYDNADGGPVDWTQACTGHPTIGYGHNLRRGLTEKQAMDLLRDDVTTAEAEVRALVDAAGPPEVWRFLVPQRQAVLIELCFAMDVTRLRRFERMLEAVRIHAYDAAAAEILDSDWARQFPGRAVELARLMEGGHGRASPW